MQQHEAFHAQARSDFGLYESIAARVGDDVAACHALHALQMSLEKLFKALILRFYPGDFKYTHKYFVWIQKTLNRDDIATVLGYPDRSRLKGALRSIQPLLRDLGQLHPDVGVSDGPNFEYPWEAPRGSGDWEAPALGNAFGSVLDRLRSPEGRVALSLVRRLIATYNTIP